MGLFSHALHNLSTYYHTFLCGRLALIPQEATQGQPQGSVPTIWPLTLVISQRKQGEGTYEMVIIAISD